MTNEIKIMNKMTEAQLDCLRPENLIRELRAFDNGGIADTMVEWENKSLDCCAWKSIHCNGVDADLLAFKECIEVCISELENNPKYDHLKK